MTRLAVSAGAIVLAASISISISGQQRPKNVREGAFTADQADRGKAGFEGVCQRCHGAALNGSEGNGPPLKGATFLAHWDKDTLGSLWVKIRDTMPLGVPGTLTDEVKLQILAYLLRQNGFPAGTIELPMDVNALEEIGIQQRGVWDGVFTAAQADRGKQSVARCQGCHGPELGGTDRAPALKGNGFLANWEDGSINRLFVKVRDTMPPTNVDSLSPETKLDIVSYLLRENGFPAGASELTLNADALDGLQIVKKGADAGAPNFALVQVVGCISRDRSSWALTNATDPVVTRDSAPSAAALKTAEAKPLGRQRFGLVSVDASTKSGALDGHKVEARGLLYRDGSYADLNLTSLKTLAASCAK
ncbi:MAG TPA: c-type cytochrome [Vicinamibacterales bacterium]|nr:c-type cytochrome [Vicinamibacterales bacterium]